VPKASTQGEQTISWISDCALYVPTSVQQLRAAVLRDMSDTYNTMSDTLKAQMEQLHSYTRRYDVDVYRSMQEAGGKLTADGGGTIAKPKFRSTLLSAFRRIPSSFEQGILDELCLVYGRGPPDTNGARSDAGRAQGGGGFLEVRWIDFCRDVGENYMTLQRPTYDAGSPVGEREALAALNAMPVGTRGCTRAQVEHAKAVICDRLMSKHSTVRDALKDVDESGDGTLTRKELKLFLSENYILKFRDFYTNEVRGELDEIVVDTLMDLVDVDGDGKIKYDEFTEIVLADANAMPNT
jgi:hypothetical protein